MEHQDNKSEQAVELSFTCPKCGGDRLYLKQIDITEVKGVFSDGDISLGDEYAEEDLGFICGGCEYELQDEDEPVVGGQHLAEWLQVNCPQTDHSSAEEDQETSET